MNKNSDNKPAPKTEDIETVETVELDNVTGGCAACGCGQPGGNPAAAMAPFLLSGFNRR